MALYSNRVAQQRSQRTRRKLYLMVISILVPFLPIVIALSVLNILAMGGIEPYNYDKIHNHAEPFEWNTILLIPSSQINWVVMNNCYISIATAVPIFVFFGMTKDAINTYRHITLWLGLGALFPGLRIEYNPDKTALSSAGTFGSSQLQPVARYSHSGILPLPPSMSPVTDIESVQPAIKTRGSIGTRPFHVS
jgi:pheromone a factor receptor